MKKLVAILIVAVTMTFAIDAGRHYADPEAAALNCNTIQGYFDQGYVMESCVQQPIYYLVAPTGTHEWGCINVELRIDPSSGLPPVSATCFIQARNKRGRMIYWETHNNVLVPIR